jgi:para-nitrobenzyl esterase
MVSPMAKGLFHKVICQSALVESILTKKNAQFWAKKMMKFMGLKTYDIKGLLEVSSEIVVNATAKLFEVFTDIMPGAWPFSPVIDNDLLPYSIIEGFNKNKAMNIPLLIGTNKDETSNFVKEKAPWLPSNEKQIDLLFKLNPHLDKRRILSNYCSYPNLDALRALTRDMSFVCGNTKLADLNSINQKTYVYRFDYETVVSKKLNLGAFHGIEIMFAFNNLDSELSKILAYETENPKIIANLVHNYWINFIKYANPNREETFYWKEYSSKNRETISLNIKPSILINPDSIGYEIWKALPLYISDLP